MLFNRKETITMQKLKPAVQELLRRDFNINHLAQIKTVYPDAYTFTQEKVHHFGTNPKSDKYQLVITPVVPHKSGRNTPDADDVLRSASLTSMTPALLLERRRKFYNTLLGIWLFFFLHYFLTYWKTVIQIWTFFKSIFKNRENKGRTWKILAQSGESNGHWQGQD